MFKKIFAVVKDSVNDFLEDDAMTQAAALAFYTTLSLGPLLVILLTVVGFTGPNARQEMVGQIKGLVGSEAGKGVEMIIQNTQKHKSTGIVSAVIGIITLLLSATGMFAQMQNALNDIWDVRAKPGQGLWNWLRKRILSAGMVMGIAFLLLVSLVISAALNILASHIGIVWQWLSLLISLLVGTLLFALIYKVLPDMKIGWRDVWIGAAVTAVLFAIGKYAIGKYLGYSSIGSAYGAAGSLVVLLVWVYYTSLIIFFGAEITQVFARKYGSGLTPDTHAEWEPGAKVKEKQDSSSKQ